MREDLHRIPPRGHEAHEAHDPLSIPRGRYTAKKASTLYGIEEGQTVEVVSDGPEVVALASELAPVAMYTVRIHRRKRWISPRDLAEII